ncbi:maltose permease [Purpureocillium lavendulum]|uniref:Maltose permease n=1 Tax=Purpureocillium lavendulum TaxID=1247861 RepID=A0AB34FWE3_9HYPO|nr:maltose permease [Purpureocillium lavendulum]
MEDHDRRHPGTAEPDDDNNVKANNSAQEHREDAMAKPADAQGRGLEIGETREITVTEHELGFWKAIRMYPQATFWAMFFCIAVVMAGFDAQIITSFYALPAFQRKYGDRVGDHYEVSAPWQTALGMGNPIGQAVGALASGYPLQLLGRRKTLAVCCCWSIGFVFVQFFATSIGMLCAGELLGGLAYGFYVVIAPTYASEICPVVLRGVLTASVNLAFVIGQFIAQGCAAGVESRLDEWAYKVPFAIQWVWPVVLLAALPFAPESPYWLIRRGRRDEARKALLKLTSAKDRPDIDNILLGIEQTDLLEREYETSTSFWDCFTGVSLRRTEISVMVYLIQVIGGNPLIGYANYFFEQAGLDSSDAFNMGVGNTALGFTGTLISWPLMNYFLFGRRTIYSSGMILMTILLFVIGFLGIPKGNKGAVWALASLMDIWTFIYQMTVGPICFVIISEISATRLRERTIAVATAVQALASIVFTVAMPYMLNSDEANWGGKTGFLFGGISLLCLVWCFYRLPESRGRTYEELDILFQRQIPARKFKDYDLVAEADAGEQPAASLDVSRVVKTEHAEPRVKTPHQCMHSGNRPIVAMERVGGG